LEKFNMSVKTERITILGSPDFKAFLVREAKKEGVSLSQLVRQRCEKKPVNSEDEELLAALVKEVNEATAKAKASLEKGLADAEQALAEMRSAK
jgi:Mg2+ and Co2+ transporter CorA